MFVCLYVWWTSQMHMGVYYLQKSSENNHLLSLSRLARIGSIYAWSIYSMSETYKHLHTNSLFAFFLYRENFSTPLYLEFSFVLTCAEMRGCGGDFPPPRTDIPCANCLRRSRRTMRASTRSSEGTSPISRGSTLFQCCVEPWGIVEALCAFLWAVCHFRAEVESAASILRAHAPFLR